MPRSLRAIIFDADDTLWDTQVLYERAKEQFYDWMAREGFGDQEAVATALTRTDLANMPLYGFSRHRFPQSMKDVYDRLTTQAGRKADPEKLEQVAEIGYGVFRQRAQLVEGAGEVLVKLQRQYRLLLYTAGDAEVQADRIQDSELGRHFQATYIRPQKTVAELAALLEAEHLQPAETWMVGNSLKSDINPALKLGLRGILVRAGGWAYDEEKLVEGRVWVVASVREIPDVLVKAEK